MFRELDGLIPSLVEQYRRGAIVFDFGLQDEVQAMQKAGLGLLKQALQALDTYGPAGRLAAGFEDHVEGGGGGAAHGGETGALDNNLAQASLARLCTQSGAVAGQRYGHADEG
jgi:hypothetical protein